MNHSDGQPLIRSTTVLAVRRNDRIAMGADGQVTLGSTTVKHDARKIRSLADGMVLCGFAGSAADVFTLLERFERTSNQGDDCWFRRHHRA